MIRQVNLYNVLAVYEGDYPIAQVGYVRSPLTRLPPFQIEIESGDTIGSFELRKMGSDTLITQLVSQIEVDTIATRTFLTYKSSANLAFALSEEGIYQAKITTGAGRVFWSHAVCMERIFQAFTEPTLSITDCTDNGGGEFDLEFELSYPSWVFVNVTMMNTTTGLSFQLSNGEAFTLDETYFATGTNSVMFKIELHYATNNEPVRHLVTRKYTFGFTPNVDPCSYTLTAQDTEYFYASEVGYLEFWNDTDLPNLGLLYQDGYKQRLYGVFHTAAPSPVISEVFNSNGRNQQFLQSAGIAEQNNYDFFPCPPYLQVVIQSVRFHNQKQIVLLDGTTQAINVFSFEARPQESENNLIGQLQCQYESNFVSGCEENIE